MFLDDDLDQKTGKAKPRDLTNMSVAELEEVLEKVQLTGEEVELLRRFRRTSAENRRMILQILGN